MVAVLYCLHNFFDCEDLACRLTVVRAKDLIASDRGGTSDPYVVINVGPGGHDAPYFGASVGVQCAGCACMYMIRLADNLAADLCAR